MNDLIERIVNAIIRQEGMPSDYINPGNLRGAPWRQSFRYTPPTKDGFWDPPTRAEGLAGLVHEVALHVAEGHTLAQFIGGIPEVYGGFAPSADHNDTEAYIANVKEWANIPDETQPLWNYLEAA